MKAKKIITLVLGAGFIKTHPGTCDGYKYGEEEKEVKKIATCMFLTPNVIREASAWGADMVITHEPTFYNHFDNFDDSYFMVQKKKALLDESGLVVYRYHDSVHSVDGDKINKALVEHLGLKGDWDGDMRITLASPVKVIDLAKDCEEKLGIKNVRIVGNPNMTATKILLNSGMRGSQSYENFMRDDSLELAISGELCEWSDCEPVRDAAEMGVKKAILVLGHVGSERDGMKDLAALIDGKYDGAEAKYFECGEVFSYTK